MKRIFTFSVITIALVILYTGCVKERPGIDESYWLSKERATVVHIDPYCQYYVVETMNGYTILRSSDGYKPYEGAVLYGNFSNYGVRDFYNRSYGIILTAEVMDFWLSYYDAQLASEYYCY